MRFDRQFYIVPGAQKIADKNSDAVAYIYERAGAPYAQVFFGKQAKPYFHFRFQDAAKREKRIREAFAGRQASLNYVAKRREDRNAATHKLQQGHVLSASWGYEQTNVNFYQVTKVVSPKMVELRPIASMAGEAQSSMSGTVFPVIDKFTGEPIRRRAAGGGVRIDRSRYASVWSGKPVFESSWH